MRYLIRDLLPHWKGVIAITILLVVQAYCSLSMPNYTANLIDVGIQHRGIENVLPEGIVEKDYNMAKVFMTKSEKKLWEKSYDKDGKVYRLNKGAKESLEKSDKLNDELVMPLVLTYQFNHINDPEFKKSIEKSGTNPEKIKKLLPMIEAGKVKPEVLKGLRNQMEKVIDKVGKSLAKGMGTAYAREADIKAGIDVDSIQMSYLWKQGLLILLLACLMFLVAGVSVYIASYVGARVGKELRDSVFKKVISYSSAEIDKFSTASLITRNTNDVQQIQLVTPMLIRIALYAPILGLGGIYMVYKSGANMSWLIAIGVVAVAIVVGILSIVSIPKFKKMQSLVDNLNLISREILTGLPVIRAFGTEKVEEKRFDGSNIDLKKNQLFTNRVMAFMMPSMFFIMYTLVVAITWVSAHKIDDGSLQVGAMTAFITYAMLIVMAFLMLAAIFVMVPRAAVAAKRINDVLVTESTIKDPIDPIKDHKFEGVVEFDRVSFRYPDAEDDAVEDISFKIGPGETLGIIGSTGCGKSTIINLIPRFYDVTKGSIKIDGIDIRDFRLKDLRDSMGIVPQKGVLFSGTIDSNIKFGVPNLTEVELMEAADIAEASEFIFLKEEGMKSHISQGGTNVSGGQKQRLAIARALAKNTPILLFDDCFSALDVKTDKNLREKLYSKRSKACKIIVAQRISTIINAKEIIVLDEGKIVGRGSHEELLKTCEVYKEIARHQLSN